MLLLLSVVLLDSGGGVNVSLSFVVVMEVVVTIVLVLALLLLLLLLLLLVGRFMVSGENRNGGSVASGCDNKSCSRLVLTSTDDSLESSSSFGMGGNDMDDAVLFDTV